MWRNKNVRMTAGIVVALLAVTTGAAASQARTAAPVDKELVAHADSARAVPAATPATIDSDVYAYTSTGSSDYFVVAGRLRLALKPGSTSFYTGTLLDYVGQKTYTANASTSNPAAPIVSFDSRNGHFRFKADGNFGTAFYSGTSTNVPSTLKVPADSLYCSGATHAVQTASYTITVSERVGPVQPQFEYSGTLTIVSDANGRISGGTVTVVDSKGRQVPHTLRGSGYYSTSYFYTTAQLNDVTFGLHGTFSGTSFSGYAFTGVGSAMSQWVIAGTAV